MRHLLQPKAAQDQPIDILQAVIQAYMDYWLEQSLELQVDFEPQACKQGLRDNATG